MISLGLEIFLTFADENFVVCFLVVKELISVREYSVKAYICNFVASKSLPIIVSHFSACQHFIKNVSFSLLKMKHLITVNVTLHTQYPSGLSVPKCQTTSFLRYVPAR